MTIVSPPMRPSVPATLLPIMAAVLAAFLTIGLALPVLPLHVHDDLGFDTFAVGLVAGSQFAASLLSRIWAGNYCDRRGAKRGLVLGLLAAAASGMLYLLSVAAGGAPLLALTVLLCGRALLGLAESFIIMGGVSWGLALVDAGHAGKVIAWVGTAMFAALAAGAPLGSALYAADGFTAIALATALAPLAVLAFLTRLSGVAPVHTAARTAYVTVIRAVWVPGIGAALSSIGYGVILAFSPLLFADRGWHPVWLAFTAYAAALILARFLFGHLPDRLGGARIALLFVLVEAAGLALIWLASGPLLAVVGAVLTGFGYSLVYPGFGAEAVRGVPAQNRGLAMGIYTAFLDIALGLGSPALGLAAARTSLGAVFLFSALIVLGAGAIALRLLRPWRS
jgi:MFS family permease